MLFYTLIVFASALSRPDGLTEQQWKEKIQHAERAPKNYGKVVEGLNMSEFLKLKGWKVRSGVYSGPAAKKLLESGQIKEQDNLYFSNKKGMRNVIMHF